MPSRQRRGLLKHPRTAAAADAAADAGRPRGATQAVLAIAGITALALLATAAATAGLARQTPGGGGSGGGLALAPPLPAAERLAGARALLATAVEAGAVLHVPLTVEPRAANSRGPRCPIGPSGTLSRTTWTLSR
jgi:hypothetical protein